MKKDFVHKVSSIKATTLKKFLKIKSILFLAAINTFSSQLISSIVTLLIHIRYLVSMCQLLTITDPIATFTGISWNNTSGIWSVCASYKTLWGHFWPTGPLFTSSKLDWFNLDGIKSKYIHVFGERHKLMTYFNWNVWYKMF